MLKKFKRIYLAIKIPSLTVSCIAMMFLVIVITLKDEAIAMIIALSAVAVINLIISSIVPKIIEQRLIKELFLNDSKEAKISIDQRALRKDFDFLSETEKLIFKMSIQEKNKNIYLYKHDLDKDWYRLLIKSNNESCVIYDSQKNPYCRWLVKYSKYIEMI